MTSADVDAAAFLTDDEVLGLAAVTGARWRVVTPTVDPWSPDDLSAATARGIRSLTVRGLLTTGEQRPSISPSLGPLVEGAFEGRLLASAYTCATGLEFDPGGVTLAAFGVTDGRDLAIVDVVSAEGVHAVVQGTHAEARSALDEAIATAGGSAGYCVVLDHGGDQRRLYRFSEVGISGGVMDETTAESGGANLAPVSRLSFDTAARGVFAPADGHDGIG